MTQQDRSPPAYPVPGGRAGRMLRLGGMTGGIVGGVLAHGAAQLARGERPRLDRALLTPATAERIARDLGRMRGAAMKLGQMLSMDTGLVLPPEMTAILAALRAEAPHMPPRQLRAVLDTAWGAGWYGRFARFDLRPFAAASIGQVHRARTRDGQDLAIKVQYPGVRASIDSDIDNVAALLRVLGVLGRDLDLRPLLAEAKAQLHAEADYMAEAAHLAHFGNALADDTRFTLPRLHAGLTRPQVLAMRFVESEPLEAVADAPQAVRDRVAEALIDLVLAELFALRRMQTDPNPANFRFDPATGRVVLLDFGAVMEIDPGMAADFRSLMRAGLSGAPDAMAAAMQAIGYFSADTAPRHRAMIRAMFDTAMVPLRQRAPFDFGETRLLEELRDMGLAMGSERDLTHIPPPATLFLHRKIGGIYLIATQLRARVALRPLLERYA
ncbi:MAG: AarF/ABC1/UbiB kinase family protein [Rhodobacteraceae bacterium]|nr:AarF/ABC1/UbiB kinase family protein [Paracoccaceae bacterium]